MMSVNFHIICESYTYIEYQGICLRTRQAKTSDLYFSSPLRGHNLLVACLLKSHDFSYTSRKTHHELLVSDKENAGENI